MKHKHTWLLMGTRVVPNNMRAFVDYKCRCGARKAQNAGSRLVKETARYRWVKGLQIRGIS